MNLKIDTHEALKRLGASRNDFLHFLMKRSEVLGKEPHFKPFFPVMSLETGGGVPAAVAAIL